ncbi:MAG: hypothetical protein KDK70_34420 [Myxococcales bacterium]|nr:hypothetical protein [Myxococcales bacterium]
MSEAWTPARVIAHIFTSTSPTGSEPPEHMAWAVFEHGTAFFCTPREDLPVDASLDAVEQAARAALAELGPVYAGTPTADFGSKRLDAWFPDDPVYAVTFVHPGIVTVVIESVERDFAAGLLGRAARQKDHDAPVLVAVRNFRGEERSSA